MTEILKRNRPGMTSVKDMPILQDVPPPGGFPAIRIERRLPSTGPTGVTIFGVTAAVMAYGYYKVWQMTKQRRLDAAETQMLRDAISPSLQAETDILYVRQQKRQAEEEQRIMSKVPGWKGDTTDASMRWIAPPQQGGVWNPILQ